MFQIETHKLEFKETAQSKVGSKDNITHKAGGGDKKVMVTINVLPWLQKLYRNYDT